MCEIQIVERGDNIYQVSVNGSQTTLHEATVDAATLQKLGVANIDKTELIKQSFLFLLEREPNTSILRRFDLSVISRYFPDYIQVMQKIFSA